MRAGSGTHGLAGFWAFVSWQVISKSPGSWNAALAAAVSASKLCGHGSLLVLMVPPDLSTNDAWE